MEEQRERSREEVQGWVVEARRETGGEEVRQGSEEQRAATAGGASDRLARAMYSAAAAAQVCGVYKALWLSVGLFVCLPRPHPPQRRA